MRKIMMTLLLFVAMAANAVNITYSLTTHTDGRTITGSASVNSVDEITNKMPQALWRAYCTYKYYSDEAMTQEISVLPEEGATVYVDYVFDPPFILSKEGEDPVWHNLRTYNEGGQNKYIMYLKQKAYPEYEGVFAWAGTKYPSYGGANSQMGIKTDCEWAFYGDAYDLSLRINDGTYGENGWLIWQNTTSVAILQLGAKPSIGWQLLVNNTYLKNSNTHYQAVPYPTMSLGVPNSNLFASLADVNYAMKTSTLSNNMSLNNKNEITANTTDARAKLWWYAFYATPVGSGSDLTYHVTYKILQQDGVNWYPDVTKPKSATAEQKPNLPDFTGKRSDCIYDGYYKDEEFIDKYGDSEKMPITGNTIVYIREILNAVPFITDHWVTIALSYKVDDLAEEWGYAADGVTPAVRFLEYYAVTTNKENTKYDLKFRRVDKIEAHKPYLFKADEVLKGKNINLSKDHNWYSKTEDELIEYVEKKKVQHKDTVNNSPYVTFIATYLDKELTVQSEHPELLYFYFGYDKRYDKENEAYVGDEEAAGKYPYNFYRVTKKNVTIPKHRCYFYIKDEKTLPQLTFTALNFIEDVNGVSDQIYVEPSFSQSQGIYNINGQLISTNAENTEGLSKGLYIINGKKVVIR